MSVDRPRGPSTEHPTPHTAAPDRFHFGRLPIYAPGWTADSANSSAPSASAIRSRSLGTGAEREAESSAGDLARVLPPLSAAERQAARRPAGAPLPLRVAEAAERRLGVRLPSVRVYDDPDAHRVARGLSARALTYGTHIAFARGRLETSTHAGRVLLGHELTHVAQQHAAGRAQVQRSPDDHARDHASVNMRFDGQDLIVTADGTEVFRFSAQSGRPVLLREEDARAVGADPIADTYMNDPRFTGVTDFGAIPEGTYRISVGGVHEFTTGEQLELLVTGHSSKVRTASAGPVSGGDWGAGRAALSPVGRLTEGPIPGANRRSGFFLHGGIMSGSSGCIDIGGSFSTLAEWMERYLRPVRVTVRYEHAAPSVGALTGFSGMLAYRRAGLSVEPKLGAGVEASGTGARLLLAPRTDVILRWAGGALSAGARFDFAVNDREQFIRLGLDSSLHFRLFRNLFGELSGGYAVGLTPGAGSGPTLGAGVSYDFGGVQLGLLYDRLWSSSAADPEVHQALIQIGLRLP